MEQIKKQMNEMPYIDKQGIAYKYGEFFPVELSPYGYNSTIVSDYFPIPEGEAERRGYLWIKIKRSDYSITKKASDITESIHGVGEAILKEVIECEECKRAYRIAKIELTFYKKVNLPIPHRCQNCRFLDRFKFINPPKLYDRKCMKCSIEVKTSYSPDRPEIVYCEKCYQQEVY